MDRGAVKAVLLGGGCHSGGHLRCGQDQSSTNSGPPAPAAEVTRVTNGSVCHPS